MTHLEFLPHFLSLLKLNTLLVCENTLAIYETALEGLLHHDVWIQLQNWKNANDLRENIHPLVLCGVDDLPYSLSFQDVSPQLTFLLDVDNLEALDESILPSLRLDSSVYAFESSSVRADFVHISELYRIKGGPLIQQHFSTWTLKTGFIGANLNVWDRRKNLRGVHMVDSWLSWPPFIFPDAETGERKGMFEASRICGVLFILFH